MIVRPGVKLGEGGCSEVFEWGGGNCVVKLAKPHTNRYAIEREYNNCKMAFERGLPAPEPYGLVEIDGRPGIVFERIRGESLLERWLRLIHRPDPSDTSSWTVTAWALFGVHQSGAETGFPDQRDSLNHAIDMAGELSATERKAVQGWLNRLPVKRQLCHGDPNPGNLMFSDGRPMWIDWNNATAGNPEADLAEYVLMLRYAVLESHVPGLSAKAVDTFHQSREVMIGAFLDMYARLGGIGAEEVDAWILPMAVRKLSSDLAKEEKERLLSEIRRRLERIE